MTELFGVPIVRVMYGVLVLLAVSLAGLVYIGWRHPLLLRIGIRNITRRPAQTALIVIGLMLSTLIISAAFATGDTVGYSIANEVYEDFQQTDILLRFDPDRGAVGAPQHLRDADLARLRADLSSDADIDGITGGIDIPAPALNRARRLSEPGSRLIGLDRETAAVFRVVRDGGTALDVRALLPGEAYVTRALANSLDAKPGDTITIYLENAPHDFRVARVIEDVLASTFGQDTASGAAVVTTLEVARTIGSRGDELDSISISVRGGVRDTLELSPAVERRVETYLRDGPTGGGDGRVPAQISLTKRQLVTIANLVGSVFVTFFVLFGLFSISAGVLLIFLIFVMLAAERRPEMGIARAVGMQRGHLTEAFIAEGMSYNLGAAAVGAGLGVGVAYLLIVALRAILAREVGLSLAFHVNPVGLVISYGLGVVLTFCTVAYSSWRAANLNIVRAIRDLPEPNALRDGRPSLAGLATGALGALWSVAWLGLAGLWVAAAIAMFIVSLPFYGIGVLLGLPLAAWFVFAIAQFRGRRRGLRGWRAVLFAAWWIAFIPVASAVVILLLTEDWAKRHRSGGGWALLMLVAGGLGIYLGGWVWGQAFAYQAGHTLAILALAMLAVYFGAPSRPAFTIGGLALVWYWLLPLPFSLLLADGRTWTDPLRGALSLLGGPTPRPINGSVEMFFVSGVSITASATLVVIFNASWFLAIIGLLGKALGGTMPAVRTAIAYPLAAKFRTGMTLAMFGLVVFSLVVMASLNYNFTQLFLNDESAVGFDVLVETNENNRIDDLRGALATTDPSALARIQGVGKLVAARAEAIEVGGTSADFARASVTGVDDEFLRLAPLTTLARANGYLDDRPVLEALRADSSTAILPAQALRPDGGGFRPGGGGGPQAPFRLSVTEADVTERAWDPIVVTVRDRETGAARDLRVIAIMDRGQGTVIDALGALVTAESNVTSTFGGGTARTYAVQTRGGAGSAIEVARAIESALLERGVEASSIHERIQVAARQSTGFQLLFEGFMGLGLVVGIAALGVIAFRTVVERRQQIGMLRAIGYTRRLVALSFFLESSFIALTGIAMGIVLGVALSYNLLTSPDFIPGTEFDFKVPWLRLAIIGAIAYGFSALMTLLPARAASRVAVAEALRYE